MKVERAIRTLCLLAGGLALAATPAAQQGPAAGALGIDLPSARFANFAQGRGLFTIAHPDNWQATVADFGDAVALAPPGGIVTAADGRRVMVYGVIVDHYAPLEGYVGRKGDDLQAEPGAAAGSPTVGSLAEASDDLVRQILAASPHLRARADGRREALDGSPSQRIVLSGRSPITGRAEQVTVATRQLADGHLLYALCVVPGAGYDSMASIFATMLRTLHVDDVAAHHAALVAAMEQPQ